MLKPKTIKCKCCGDRGTPKNNSTIGYYCDKEPCQDARIKKALEKGRQSIKRAVKETNKEWNDYRKQVKEKHLGHGDYIQLLQKVFNTFIRMRDKGNGCISCGTHADVIYAAGHFHPTTYSYLRFNEDNVHLQCNEHCNRQKRGNLSEYRPALIKKIGVERVEQLDNDRHKKLDLSIPEIKDLIEVYKKKIKQLNIYK